MEAQALSGAYDLQIEHMSLSGITERFGEPGLRRRYSMEIAAFSIEDQQVCMQALADVTHLFRNDTYKNLPYTTHLLRTPIRLMRDYDVRDPEVIVSMVYHDGPEDHPKDLVKLSELTPPTGLTDQESALWVLGERYTPRVEVLVGSVTNQISEMIYTPAEKRLVYADNVANKIALSVNTFLMKLSDLTDNGVGLLWTDVPERLPHFAQKYYPLFDVFLVQLRRYQLQGELSKKQISIANTALSIGKLRCEVILKKHGLFDISNV